MKEHPILFRPEMVRAILDGRKTQTRRLIRPQPHDIDGRSGKDVTEAWQSGFIDVPCPYGNRGDRLWVRETWSIDSFSDTTPIGGPRRVRYHIEYKAEKGQRRPDGRSFVFTERQGKLTTTDHWKPSIFMPRWACRLELAVQEIRVERLDEISDVDALQEGVCGRAPEGMFDSARSEFRAAFRAMRKLKTSDNPWLWVVDFRRAK